MLKATSEDGMNACEAQERWRRAKQAAAEHNHRQLTRDMQKVMQSDVSVFRTQESLDEGVQK